MTEKKEEWLKIYEDLYKVVNEINPPAPIIMTMIALCKWVAKLQKERDELVTLRKFDDWYEDASPMLWWRHPVSEPPYCGTPYDEDWPWAKSDEPNLVWLPCPNPLRDRL